MYEWLNQVPLFWAIIITVILYIVMIIWTWTRPQKYIFAGAPNNKAWRDLRLWATLLMIFQIIIYIAYGI